MNLIFNDYYEPDYELLTVLTNISISTKDKNFNVFEEDELHDKDKSRNFSNHESAEEFRLRAFIRHQWEQYIREMEIFYVDLLVEFVNAASKVNMFTPEDCIVMDDICGKQNFSLTSCRSLHGG